MIRSVTTNDATAIAHIYNHYITHTVVSFEEQLVSVTDIEQRILNIQAHGLPWLIAEESNQVVGYAYANVWKSRSAYRFTVEVSVYLQQGLAQKGLGTQLYEALFLILKDKGIHVAIACIALPNPASVALHEKFNMKKVAHFEQVGFKFNQWLDIGYWQVLL
jgi:L-amino acid N-acyltransferase YncA